MTNLSLIHIFGIFGWQWGFVGSSVAGVLGVLVIVFLLHDTPESKGLPPVSYTHLS